MSQELVGYSNAFTTYVVYESSCETFQMSQPVSFDLARLR